MSTHTARVDRLTRFVAWTQTNITGNEKSEAQIFLDRLFQAFGQQGALDVGGTPEFKLKSSRETRKGTSFADYVWKPVVLIEMKRRGEKLSRHYRQAFDYWVELVPNRPAYVVLCNFDEFWIYDFNRQMHAPVDRVSLTDLPARHAPLAFLFPGHEEPVFENDHVAVTRDAATGLAACYRSLINRRLNPDTVRNFILQMLVALFAEDIGLLPSAIVPRLLEDCGVRPEQSYDVIGDLFQWMNTPGIVSGGRYKGVQYFNGGLFSIPARLELVQEELDLLRRASAYDWAKVSPDIFGTLFEQSLIKTERHAFGAYFTSPVDIMKIVGPTIIDPWRARIDSATTIRELDRLLERIVAFRVLDPACGSGNFLYIAYRELKRLEAQIYDRRAELSRATGPIQEKLRFVDARQFYGIDINSFAVELAKVTLMIAHKLVIDELELTHEAALPLANLDANFMAADALVDEEGRRRRWPDTDVIIGNPPFLGAKRLKPERGVAYVNTLRQLYPSVPAMADYCVYWFRHAHDHLPMPTAEDPLRGRAGLVGTQNIRSNQSRVGGLDHITQFGGTILEAISNQPWSGDSAVHVAIVNWIKTTDSEILPTSKHLWAAVRAPATKAASETGRGSELHRYEVPYIGASLTEATGHASIRSLPCNRDPKRCFQGKIPGYEGFLIDKPTALRYKRDSAPVIYPYLTGRELLSEFRIERWIIDFGNRDITEASRFDSAFEHCRQHVLPKVQASYEKELAKKTDMVQARHEHLDRWWQLWNRRDELSRALSSLTRYIGCSRVTRRPIMAFLSTSICPSDLVQVFTFDDDYSFGILQSTVHFEWFRFRSSRLKVESDLRYSVRDVFETFPWPQGDDFNGPRRERIVAVAEAGRRLRDIRAELLSERRAGLRDLYRTLDLPGRSHLRSAHETLDEAVIGAYGFRPGQDVVRSLSTLNAEMVRRSDNLLSVVAPGIPDATIGATIETTDAYRPDW